jgi:hypothetical protein
VGLLQFPANSPENADSCFLVTLQRVSLTDSRATQGGRTQCNCPIRKPIRSCCLLFPENSQHDLHGQHSCAILESVLLFGRTVYIGLAVAVIRNRRHGGKTVASRAVLCWGWDREYRGSRPDQNIPTWGGHPTSPKDTGKPLVEPYLSWVSNHRQI